MKMPVLAAVVALAVPALAHMALAQQAASPSPPPRAPAPALAPSVQAAQAAVAACAAKGFHVTTLITDSAGDPVVLLSGDGASLLGQKFARAKAAIVIRYKVSSGEVAAKAKTDAGLSAEIKADPNIGGVAFAGAVPLKKDGALIGAFAVSGAGGPDMDESCVLEALAKVPALSR